MSKKLLLSLGAFALGIGAGVALKELWDQRDELFAKDEEDGIVDPVPADANEAACECDEIEVCEQPCDEPTSAAVQEPCTQEHKNAEDSLFAAAVALVTEQQKASTSLLQRHLGIGYGRALKLITAMETLELIGPADGYRARKVLPAAQEYLERNSIA